MSKVIFWYRRDLRLNDNAGLYHALKSGKEVVPIFIFDHTILQHLPKKDKRVMFIHNTITSMVAKFAARGCNMQVYYGTPTELIPQLVTEFSATAVYTNHDYEPKALLRDATIKEILEKTNVQMYTYKDQCIFEQSEVVKDDGKPYTVFTPYSRKWKAKFNGYYSKAYPTEKYMDALCTTLPNTEIPTIAQMGFEPTTTVPHEPKIYGQIIKKYHNTRDIPSVFGTSKISVHLRFGTISIRALVAYAYNQNEKYLNELIWRDFYMQILWHYPHVTKTSFKPQYDNIQWTNNQVTFDAWCKGKTGYPIVDAGMRELNTTGWMHNRVRMIVASFLTKHLLIDWRWGEAYFAEKLLDFELSSNNGGWQWASGSGVDAAPYFRIFNPYLQTEKFDKKEEYIKQWVPEYKNTDYPKPIIVHEVARERCLLTYKVGLEKV